MGTTNTLDLNNRVSALEKAVSGGDSAQANKKDIATEFSATTAYTAGCFVYYQGKLYQFNTDHAAGAWDSTDVVEANVTDQIVSNKAAIDGLTASDVAYDNTDSGLTATNLQGAVDELRHADNIMLSDGVTSVEDRLDANALGSVVNILSYTESRPYTFPSDGYVMIRVSSSSSSSSYISLKINDTMTMLARQGASDCQLLPVKKGMQCYTFGSSGTVESYFYPLR